MFLDEFLEKPENYQVVKQNILNEAKLCNRITLVEYRLLLMAMSI